MTTMPALHELPDLEQTVGDLVLDLLRAQRLYPELIFSDPLDQRGEVSSDAVRVTQHYVTALLAYGFSRRHRSLVRAAEWFDAPFPNEFRNRVDAVEMNRLEALLMLDVEQPGITARLEQLAAQRTIDGNDFVIAGRSAEDFDTLWALKVMQLAEQRALLNGLIDPEQLRQLAGRVVMTTKRDKDLALALRLRYELAGKLRTSQEGYLDKLLKVAHYTGGVWGLDRDMIWIADYMRQQQLTAGDFANHRDALREMILSTCYVIENLMPLVAEYNYLVEPLQQAMELWWGVFYGPNALNTLHALFPMPYDYLLILSRTLVTLRAYLGDEPLIQLAAAYVHQKLADQEMEHAETPERDSIKQALRKWLIVELHGPEERLRLGMSDTDIVRVRPLLRNPMLPDEESSRLHIPYADSVVVKFGKLEEIQRERENYYRLPVSIRDCFARVPRPIHVDEEGRGFLVLQDLFQYWTLDETMRRVPQAREALTREIGPFLHQMHYGRRRARPAPYGLLWDLYLLPMQEHIGRIFTYIQDNNLHDDTGKQHDADQLKGRLLDLMGDLVRYQLLLEGFPMAYMHGDLHSRNIMVRRIRQRDRGETDNELDFKLIDLEKLRLDGDAALDAGELLADLNIARDSLKGSKARAPYDALIDAVAATYVEFAASTEDRNFAIRLELAQARALIRVGKGRTKVGIASLRESRRAPAIRIANEVQDYAQEAATHLATVVDALKNMDKPPFVLTGSLG
ncbi:MAG: phosphotransferase [Anaerolineae bacterium]|nr:phosphotransferase [Anaerolineae bacterium]